ncbi:MAG: hypothetical protein U9R14_04165 [Patescibacteria group bacterium]|nr:hypothetical protein [Patescibacteria group bacterium]
MKIQEHVKTEYFIYPSFYEEFYKNFLMREKGINYLVLAGVFLHLTFENIVTFHIRYFINYTMNEYIKGGFLQQFWDKNFENETLYKKLDYFYFIILSADESSNDIIVDIKNFYKKLAYIRNKIVHGHEIWEKKYHNGKTEKSGLSIKLDKKEIEKLYNDFWLNLKNFLNLFILVNSILPDKTRCKEEFIKGSLIDKPIKTLENIERTLSSILAKK